MAPRLKSLYIVFIKYSQRGDKLAATSAGFPLPALPVVCEAIGSDRWLCGGWSDRWQTGGWLLGQTGGWLAGQTGGCGGGLVRQVADKWLVAWSLTAIVREVSDRV